MTLDLFAGLSLRPSVSRLPRHTIRGTRSLDFPLFHHVSLLSAQVTRNVPVSQQGASSWLLPCTPFRSRPIAPLTESQALLLRHFGSIVCPATGQRYKRKTADPRPCWQVKFRPNSCALFNHEILPFFPKIWGFSWRVRSRSICAVRRVWRLQLKLDRLFRRGLWRD